MSYCSSYGISLALSVAHSSPRLLSVALQVFTVAEPVWLKYIQFHFISHHGSEPICALNDVLVFGKSAAEDLEDQLSEEALLTPDDHPQQPETAPHSHTTADWQHGAPDLGKLDKAVAAGSESDLGPEAAVERGRAAVEAVVDKQTVNRTSASEVLLLANSASSADRPQAAAGDALGEPRTGQQCCLQERCCVCLPWHPCSLRSHCTWTVGICCHKHGKRVSLILLSALCPLVQQWGKRHRTTSMLP